jgi:hypothetical protein
VIIRKRGGFSAKFTEPTGFDLLDSCRLDLDPAALARAGRSGAAG